MTPPSTQPTGDAPPAADSRLSHLRSLDDIDGAALPLVGGKAFRLAMLKQHGFLVPPGLVLTTHFFETHLKQAKLTPLWAGSPDIAVTSEALSWLADALKTRPLAPALGRALYAQLNDLFGPQASRFAVRSSVIDEDQRDHTFAGIHLSELDVPLAVLQIAISRCWASALSPPAIAYRQQHGMSIQAIQIAVLIQPMLAPQCAGVGFTANPLTGARQEIIIESVQGLGITLVSGRTRPHFYRVAKQPPDYPLIEQRRSDASATGSHSEPDAGLLADDAVRELAHQLQQIEALMGEPQDVEWARQAEQFYMLQTRPVILPPEPQPVSDQRWGRIASAENLPEIPSPYLGALVQQAQPVLIQSLRTMGFNTHQFQRYQRFIFGRLYFNVSLLRRMSSQVGLDLVEALAYGQSTPEGHRSALDWRVAWQARRVYRQLLQQQKAADQVVGQLDQQVNSMAEQLTGVNVTATEPTVLLRQLHQQTEAFTMVAKTGLELQLGAAIFTMLANWLAPNAGAIPVAAQAAPPGSLEQALADLSRLAANDDTLAAYLRDTANQFDTYPDHPAISTPFRDRLEALLADFGEQATYSADPAQPRYREAPADLLHQVGQFLQGGRPAAAAEPSIWQRWLSRPGVQLEAARQRLQEILGQCMAVCRRWTLALGQEWTANGWLDAPDDIFWLTPEEIKRTLMAGQSVAITLSSTVQARKTVYRGYAQTGAPRQLQESQLPTLQLGLEAGVASAAADVVVGQPVSPGQARGVAVVVHRPDINLPTNEQLILVMPSTGPDWLPLLHHAAGLIVETGGLLSHGSVIAREYGIPAVANIPQATRRFQTGDRVLVDGSTGVIQLLEPGRPARGA